jgi:putative transposase
MPYTKIWVHTIWTTKNRKKIITKNLKSVLCTHIRENAKTKDIFLDFINCTEDHVHAIISMSIDQNISQLMKLIKGESSYWVNKNNLISGHFEWQDEYIAFSVSHSMINVVRNYIKNQEKHHSKRVLKRSLMK